MRMLEPEFPRHEQPFSNLLHVLSLGSRRPYNCGGMLVFVDYQLLQKKLHTCQEYSKIAGNGNCIPTNLEQSRYFAAYAHSESICPNQIGTLIVLEIPPRDSSTMMILDSTGNRSDGANVIQYLRTRLRSLEPLKTKHSLK
jgi:hypothetical protein